MNPTRVPYPVTWFPLVLMQGLLRLSSSDPDPTIPAESRVTSFFTRQPSFFSVKVRY